MYTARDGKKYNIDLKGNLLLKAAFEVAVQAHGNQTRDDGERLYITDHLIPVYNILREFGFNVNRLAIGLLHDSIEDHYRTPERKRSVEQLQDLLQRDLIKALHDKKTRKINKRIEKQWEAWAKGISAKVMDLTNGAVQYDGKRTWQVDHVQDIDLQIRYIKIIDQVASVIDDIKHCKLMDRNFDIHTASLAKQSDLSEHRQVLDGLMNALGFALKGYDVAEAAVDYDERNVYYIFYAQIYAMLRQMYDAAEKGDYDEAKRIRAEVSHPNYIAATIKKIKEGKRLSPKAFRHKPESTEHCYYERLDDEKGIQDIVFSRATGKVVGYSAIYDHDPNADHTQSSEKNKRVNDFRIKLEGIRNVRITTKGIQIFRSDGQRIATRDFHIQNPLAITVNGQTDGMDFKAFLDAAMAEPGKMLDAEKDKDFIELCEKKHKNIIKNIAQTTGKKGVSRLER